MNTISTGFSCWIKRMQRFVHRFWNLIYFNKGKDRGQSNWILPEYGMAIERGFAREPLRSKLHFFRKFYKKGKTCKLAFKNFFCHFYRLFFGRSSLRRLDVFWCLGQHLERTTHICSLLRIISLLCLFWCFLRGLTVKNYVKKCFSWNSL